MRVPRLVHDALLARPVFIAPDRARRPGDFGGVLPERGTVGTLDRCPFCAGNEPLTPPEVLRAPAAEPGLPGGGPWRARIVPNRFPFVVVDAGTAADGGAAAARGIHDVVVESPDHVESVLDIDPAGWRDVWLLCRERMAMLAARDDVAWATLFKNSGPAAGASLEHVHSQLVALDFVPPTIRAELAAALGPTDPFAALLDQAVAAGRLVADTRAEGFPGGAADGLVAIVPPAPRQPFETWILPRAASPYLHEASDDALAAIADLTRRLIGRLERLVPGANYNWWLHQPPFAAAAGLPHATEPAPPHLASAYRWHLEIVPRINGLAGFELGTGCHVTTLAPEECARLLREA